MRVRKSAIGIGASTSSVYQLDLVMPGIVALVGGLAQADPAEAELAVVRRAGGRSAGSGCSSRVLYLGSRCLA